MEGENAQPGAAGAFGVNYALRPHKFVDRRIFIEALIRYSNFFPIQNFTYIGLGSYAMEDHKLMNSSFGITNLISLEVDRDVLLRQKYNLPLACIKPTLYSADDFIAEKISIFRELGFENSINSIVWLDMTDATSLRSNLGSFQQLLQISERNDIVRMTVDIDEKRFGRKAVSEQLDLLQARRFETLKEMLDDDLMPGAKVSILARRLGIAQLVTFAFKTIAEKALNVHQNLTFEPISITTYADGHRMLSITGAILDRSDVERCRRQADLHSIPGGAQGWDSLTDIQIPQLTVWEKLSLDRQMHRKSRTVTRLLKYKLHDTISNRELINGYCKFYRFYPTFRYVTL